MGTQPLRRAADRSLLRRRSGTHADWSWSCSATNRRRPSRCWGSPVVAASWSVRSWSSTWAGARPRSSSSPRMRTRWWAPSRSAPRVSLRPSSGTTLRSSTEIAELRRAATGLAASLPTGTPERGIVSGGSGTNVSRLLGRERTRRCRSSEPGGGPRPHHPGTCRGYRPGDGPDRAPRAAAGGGYRPRERAHGPLRAPGDRCLRRRAARRGTPGGDLCGHGRAHVATWLRPAHRPCRGLARRGIMDSD